MSTFGIFTRVQAKSRVAKAPRDLGNLNAASLHQMGVKAIRQMNPQARYPQMEAIGAKKPIIYVLGEAPNEGDDEKGEPFTGPNGRMLRNSVPAEYENNIRFNNCVRTLPKLRGGNRRPSAIEIECFRPSIEFDIEDAKPDVILGCGDIPLKWMLGAKVPGIKVCRGRWFPVKVGRHVCWFYSVLHPAFINRIANGREDGVPGGEWRNTFNRDLKQMYERLPMLPAAEVQDTRDEVLLDRVTCYHGGRGELDKIADFLAELATCKAAATDLESNCLRPYKAGAKLLAVSFGKWHRAISVAYDHPQAKWTPKERKHLDELTVRFLCAPDCTKIAHNAPVECEWFNHRYGERTIRSSPWRCTMQQAYSLDERHGLGLGFLCTHYFGVDLKKLSKGRGALTSGFFADETTIDRTRLEKTDLQYVLRYNALDSKFTDRLDVVQRRRLKDEGLWTFYKEFQNPRVLPAVMAQSQGMLVDAAEVKRQKKLKMTEADLALKAVNNDPDVLRYQRQFGTFDPNSNLHLKKLFWDMLKRKECERKQGNKVSYSTDEEVLHEIGSSVPLAGKMLKMRKPQKLVSTYITPLDITAKDNVVYPDGKIHAQFNLSKVGTGRWSAEDPNVTNFPKHKNKEVRRAIVAAAGEVMIAVDYGALEYCGIGMASKDPVIVKSLFNNYDVHMEWTRKLAKVFPKWFQQYKDEREARQVMKNKMVFPCFYGAKFNSLLGYLEIVPARILQPLYDEFWYTFGGVRKWQQSVLAFYAKHGYVECLSGRRRRGPLSENKIINSPIQGTASDIVVDAMTRLSALAYKLGRPYLSPLINVHDDLTFCVPRKHAEDCIEIIVREMLTCPFAWARIVPLTVEVSVGQNWCDLVEIGKFRSDQLN